MLHRQTKMAKISIPSENQEMGRTQTSFTIKLSKKEDLNDARELGIKVKIADFENDDRDRNEETYQTMLTQKWRQFDREQEVNKRAKVTFPFFFF